MKTVNDLLGKMFKIRPFILFVMTMLLAYSVIVDRSMDENILFVTAYTLVLKWFFDKGNDQ